MRSLPAAPGVLGVTVPAGNGSPIGGGVQMIAKFKPPVSTGASTMSSWLSASGFATLMTTEVLLAVLLSVGSLVPQRAHAATLDRLDGSCRDGACCRIVAV